MKLSDYPGWVQVALCAFESLRRFGNAADDIYFQAIKEDGRLMGCDVLVVADDVAVFGCRCIHQGAPPITEEQFEEALALWNNCAHEERDDLWQRRESLGFHDVPFAMACAEKGVIKPFNPSTMFGVALSADELPN